MKKGLFLFLSTFTVILCLFIGLSPDVAAFAEPSDLSVAEDSAPGIADGVFTKGSISYDGSYTVTLPQNLSSTANTATVHDVIRQGYFNCDKEINPLLYRSSTIVKAIFSLDSEVFSL